MRNPITFSIMLFACYSFSSPYASEPLYSYQNAIRESIFVAMPPNNIPIAVDIIRPRETEQGLKVPVIMEASPYYETLGRGTNKEIKKYDKNGVITHFPLFYDNYFVPRGYAVVLVDVIGTNRSHGCPTIGGQRDIDAAKIVIDWLNGRAHAFAQDGTEKKATWSTGKVGMIGKSYDGSIANGVAATGVDGLTTVVSIASISSWYDWIYPNSHPDLKSLLGVYDLVINHRHFTKCSTDREAIAGGMANETKNYNSFWHERNYLKNSKDIKASFFVVSGLNDTVVRMNQTGKLWQALSEHNIPRKLWLSQSEHVDPFDYRRAIWVDTLQRWFDYWLLDINNGIMSDPAVSIERGENNWEEHTLWPNEKTEYLEIFLTPNTHKQNGIITFTPPPAGAQQSYVSDHQKEEILKFISPPLAKKIRLNGAPRIHLVTKTNTANAHIGVGLVDYGVTKKLTGQQIQNDKDCWGESTNIDSACYAKYQNMWTENTWEQVTFAFFNARHWRSLVDDEALVPNQWYPLIFDGFPDDYEFKAGNRIGITIQRSDTAFTTPTIPTEVTIDLAKSKIILPVVISN